jgi:hypothetical protein
MFGVVSHGLPLCFSKEEALASIAYSYKHGFSGFAAMLTEEQADNLAGELSLANKS